MKRTLYIFLCLLAFSCQIKELTVDTPAFFRLYSGEGGELYGMTVDRSEDGYIMLVGKGHDLTPQLFKTDADGDLYWIKSYPQYENVVRELRLDETTNYVFYAKKTGSETAAIVTVDKTTGVVLSEMLFPEFNAPTFMVKLRTGGEYVLTGTKISQNANEKPTTFLMRVNINTKKVVWKQVFDNISNGDDLEFPYEPSRVLSELSDGGFTFIGFRETTQPIVHFTDANGVLLERHVSSRRLANYTESREKGTFAAVYSTYEGGVQFRIQSKQGFEESAYLNPLPNTKMVSIPELDGLSPTFVRPDAGTTFTITGTTNISEIAFMRYTSDAIPKAIFKKSFGAGSNEYFAATRAREAADGGYFMIGNTRIGKQSPIDKICLIKTNKDGELKN